MSPQRLVHPPTGRGRGLLAFVAGRGGGLRLPSPPFPGSSPTPVVGDRARVRAILQECAEKGQVRKGAGPTGNPPDPLHPQNTLSRCLTYSLYYQGSSPAP